MVEKSFYEPDGRVLTPLAFQFALDNEVKRASRSQNFLTFVLFDVKRQWQGLEVTADDGTMRELARLVEREVRDTDLLGELQDGSLSVLLLDAGVDDATRVVDRLMSRVDSFEFPVALRVSVGAACFPTHANDAESLKERAALRPMVNWQGGPSQTSA